MDNLDMSKAEDWTPQDLTIDNPVLAMAVIDYGTRTMHLKINGECERRSAHISFPAWADTPLKLREALVREASRYGLELCYTEISEEY